MPIFMCEEPGCLTIDNTAVTHYWTRDAHHWPKAYRGRKLCSEHGPPFMIKPHDLDEKPICKTYFGKWHNRFPKRSAVGMMVDDQGFLWSKDQVRNRTYGRNTKIVGEVTEGGVIQPIGEESHDKN